jgi:hypothetical protein
VGGRGSARWLISRRRSKRYNDDYPEMEPFASREILRVQELDGGKGMLQRRIPVTGSKGFLRGPVRMKHKIKG